MKLVPNRWYAVLDPRSVPPRRPIRRRRLGRDLVFWRDATGRIRAADDRCPHRHAAMSAGTIEDGCLVCPFHGFAFDADGACVRIPAHPDRPISPAMALATWPVREAHDLVFLWTGPGPAPGDVPFFDLDGHLHTGSHREVAWNVHYTRAIENQLDWAHLPFVHRSTIGRFSSVEVDIETSMDGDHLYSGLRGEPPGIHFIGPNLWQLRLSPDFFNFLAFVPVDETAMIYLTRSYQRMVTTPPLAWLLGLANAVFNPVVLAQDHRVVRTQPPEPATLRTLGLPVPSDSSIVAYHRWREARLLESEAGS